MQDSDSTPAARYVRYLLCATLAAVVTLLTVRYSFQYGRLIYPPQYDDVNYMADGLRWLRVLQNGGLAKWLTTAWVPAPHSPFSTCLAMVSFLVLGQHDWAVNGGNFLVVLAYLLIADQLLGGVRLVRRAAVLLLAASVPLAAAAVFHFRPDAMCGVMTAGAIVLTVWGRALGAGPWRRAVWLGLMLAMVLLTKPSVFVMTLVVVLGMLGVAVITEWLGKAPALSAQRVAGRIALALGVMVITVLPYYMLCGPAMFKYMWDNIFGKDRESWVLAGGWAKHAGYYLTGDGGRLQLGGHLWLLAALVAAGLWWAWKRWERGKAVRFTGLVVLIAAVYALVTANAVKNAFFGLTFQVLLVYCAVIVLGEALGRRGPASANRAGGPGARWATAAVWGLAALGVGLFQFPPKWAAADDPGVLANGRMVAAVQSLLEREITRPTQVIMLTTNGHAMPETMLDHHIMNASLIHYLFLRDRGAAPILDHRYFREPSAGMNDELVWADFLVASEPGGKIPFDFQKSSRHEQEWLDAVRGRTDWREIGHFVGASGKGYYVFRHERGQPGGR